MMMRKVCEGTSKLDRKTVEKNRRLHMKKLCFKLASLIPRDATSTPKSSFQVVLTQHDHLDQATTYIKNLQEGVEELKHKKDKGMTIHEENSISSSSVLNSTKLPIIEIRELEYSTLEILLICGLDKRFVFYEVISVVEEEGAEVVNATSSIVGGKIFYTIHSHISLPIIGLEASRVSERLKKLIH